MSMDKSAIEQIQKAEATATSNKAIAEVGALVPVIALPCEQQLHNMEKYLAGRMYFRGEYKTTAVKDFVKYGQQHQSEGAQCFVDPERMAACAFFNLGDEKTPGHGDWQAKLAMQKTAPFRALLSIDGEPKSQKTLAEWLEDWRDYVVAFNSEGEAVEIAKAVAAVRRLTIESSRKEDHDTQDFRQSRSALESVEARSDHGLPAGFRFECEPYLGLALRSFEVRLSILTGGDAPKLTARIRKLELQEQEMGQELCDKLESEFEMTTQMGSFSL